MKLEKLPVTWREKTVVIKARGLQNFYYVLFHGCLSERNAVLPCMKRNTAVPPGGHKL